MKSSHRKQFDFNAHTLYFDIEKTPTKGWAYKSWEANLFDIEEDWIIQSISWAWGKHGKINVKCLADFPLYTTEPHNDYELVNILYQEFKKAHIIVGHNVRKFDMKMTKHRFIIHSLPPIGKLNIRDTLTMARKYGFISNSLDNVSRELGTGHKLECGVKDLWKKCHDGEDKYWKLFKKYNAHDVRLTRANDIILSSWEDTLPRMSMDEVCPSCGSKENEWKRNGTKYYPHYWRQRYACIRCGFTNIYSAPMKNEWDLND